MPAFGHGHQATQLLVHVATNVLDLVLIEHLLAFADLDGLKTECDGLPCS